MTQPPQYFNHGRIIMVAHNNKTRTEPRVSAGCSLSGSGLPLSDLSGCQ